MGNGMCTCPVTQALQTCAQQTGQSVSVIWRFKPGPSAKVHSSKHLSGHFLLCGKGGITWNPLLGRPLRVVSTPDFLLLGYWLTVHGGGCHRSLTRQPPHVTPSPYVNSAVGFPEPRLNCRLVSVQRSG